MYRRTKHCTISTKHSNHHDLFPGFKSPSFRKMHLYHVITALSIILFLTGPCFQSAAHPAAIGTAAHKSDLQALTRITGIVHYYSPNPFTAGWNSFDWFFIEYSRFKALEQGQTLETVLQPYLEVLASDATLTRQPQPGTRTLADGLQTEEYRYWLHHGSGEVQIPSYARLFMKELRDYRPFYKELVQCTPSPAPELPRPDSIYSFRVSDSLWLNLPLAESAAAFSKKATAGLCKGAERQWKQALRSYGGNKRRQLQGILGEKAFRMADIAARWNIVQHFYPYHEEDGLQWEDHLPEMIEAVDTLKNGILSREDILSYHEAVVRTMGPVRDAHLDISASLHPGFGIVSYYLAEANTTAAPAADTAGTEAEVRAEIIDSILIFNPSLTMECYEEFLPYLDSIIAGEYRAVAFDLREYPALDFDRVLAHLTDSALNTAPLFHTPLSCFPDRMHLRWDSRDDFVRPAAPRIDLPVYFLCGPESMSWCETVLMLVKGYGLGTVIGSSTTGTNGDASTFQLPAFPFRMTAVKAVNLDGSRHHGTGVQPDIPAEIGSYEDAVRIIENML